MPERLRPLDMAFLAMESARTPMHVATLDIFAPDEVFDYERLVGLINDRIAFVPRYRQKVRQIPGRVANPVWVDDEDFDLAYHVRRSALPRPGSMDQLRDLVARIMSRRLDRGRPLWETYLVEGLEGGRYAVLSKSHQVLVDGTTVDLGQLIVDDSPDAPATPGRQLDAGARPRRRSSCSGKHWVSRSVARPWPPKTCAVTSSTAPAHDRAHPQRRRLDHRGPTGRAVRTLGG